MKVLNLALGKTRRDICPVELEKLFAEGLTNTAVARRLKMSVSFLSKKIGNSATLTEARERGLRRKIIMPRKNAEFIGTYAPKTVKEYLQYRARNNNQTVSQVILEIITKEIQEEQQNRRPKQVEAD